MSREFWLSEIFANASKLLKGKLPRGLWLSVGPPGVGKTNFTIDFVCRGMKNNEAAIIVLTDADVETVALRMEGAGLNANELIAKGLLRIVDCFSWRSGAPLMDSVQGVFRVQNANNVNEINLQINKAIEKLTSPRFVLDSISTIAADAAPGTGEKFLSTLVARVRKIGGYGFGILEFGAHEPKFMNLLRFLFDGVFEFKITEDPNGIRRYMRVYSLKGGGHDTAWHQFEITDSGIQMVE